MKACVVSCFAVIVDQSRISLWRTKGDEANKKQLNIDIIE